jgi:hypothetical protein
MRPGVRRFAAAGVAVFAAVGLMAMPNQPRAAASPGCTDYVWIGVAGSGERGASSPVANMGMGNYMARSYADFMSEAATRDKTVRATSVAYRAMDVSSGMKKPHEYRASMDEGVTKLRSLINQINGNCGNRTKLVLAGYSQGAAVVHRVLQRGPGANFGGALLLADPDRLTYDTAVASGTAAAPVVGAIAGEGIAQVFSQASARKLAGRVGAKTLSYCNLGDLVCNYNPGASVLPVVGVGVHTSYDPATWRIQLADLILPPKTKKTKESGDFVGRWIGIRAQVNPVMVDTQIVDLGSDGRGIGATSTVLGVAPLSGVGYSWGNVITKTKLEHGRLRITGGKQTFCVTPPELSCVGSYRSYMTRRGAELLITSVAKDPRGGGTIRSTAVLQRVG